MDDDEGIELRTNIAEEVMGALDGLEYASIEETKQLWQLVKELWQTKSGDYVAV